MLTECPLNSPIWVKKGLGWKSLMREEMSDP